jgi:hypothetical protein
MVIFKMNSRRITTAMNEQQHPDEPDQQQANHLMHLHFDSIYVSHTPVHEIKTLLFIPAFDELIKDILTSHGALLVEEPEIIKNGRLLQMAHIAITFPEGTYRSELLPRTHDERYRIVFPDGYDLLELCRRDSPFSYLRFDSYRGLTPEQIEKFKAATGHK